MHRELRTRAMRAMAQITPNSPLQFELVRFLSRHDDCVAERDRAVPTLLVGGIASVFERYPKEFRL